MSIWRVVVDALLPPPLILSILLLLPMPRVVTKGLLSFARNVLFFEIAGAIKLVHFMVLVSGLMLLAAGVHTRQMQQAMPHYKLDTMDPKQQFAARARIWREERNFWISALTFLLWAFLYRINALMLDHVNVHDKLKCLQEQLSIAPPPSSGGVPAPKAEEPTAPAVPEPSLRQRKARLEETE